jgi:hypothetical protein
MSEPCYRAPDNGVRFVRNGHRHDCAEPECRGCTPCAERWHCTARKNCTWHLAYGELTCGRCIAGVRHWLKRIADGSALMLTAAIADGLESEALNLAGPAVDPEAWSWRKVAAKQGVAWHVSLIEEDDEHHPARVLGTWARMISEDYSHDMPANAPLSWSVDYLGRNLYRIANDDEQDFGLLRAELKKCGQHLEAVLHNDTRRDRGAFCPTCRAAGALTRLELHYAHWCEDEACERFHFTDDASDVWRCPRDREHWWTQGGYADLLSQRRSSPPLDRCTYTP